MRCLYAVSLFVSILPLACKDCDCQSEAPGSIQSEIVDTYVQVNTPDGATGAGVVVDFAGEKLILTCAHVVEDAPRIAGKVATLRPLTVKKIKNGETLYAAKADIVQVGNSNTGVDLALIRPRSNPPRAAKWCPQSPARLGEDCWYIGTPGGVHARLERSIISQVAEKCPLSDGTFVAVNGCGYYGSSGGPVFVLRDGHYYLTGIVSRGGPDMQRNPKCIVYAVDHPTIKAFLETYTNPARPTAPEIRLHKAHIERFWK